MLSRPIGLMFGLQCPVMPDALSKTVPIWCAVMNRALFPAETEYHAVRFPPNFLGASEESQIEDRINGFVDSFKVIIAQDSRSTMR